MTGPYLLDANIFIAALREHPAVLRRMAETSTDHFRLSAVVLGELEFGAEKSAYGERNRKRLAEMVLTIPFVGLDRDSVHNYAQLRAFLDRQGTPIGANDMWIAAQALSIGATLVTDNEREFRRVPDLKVENWLRD
ncbi:PIN domain-containing protein [Methylopila sp. M107]|uniref:PIN domain-containing protein n=1 Tax=Methylopila sp. M107 TaxID=1101190 RepID=UPI0004784D4F|nr:PIN domain-containing protein [Methylopila sp. M107]